MGTLTFADGGTIPTVGLGTWPLVGDECARVVAEAIDMGYRLIDTAYAYENEDGVGRGIKASGIAREQVFITTKFNKEDHSVDGVARAFERSAAALDVDYIDLMLVHWPNPEHNMYVEAWLGLISLQEQGKVRHIGTSNFLPDHLARIIGATGVTPALDQLQINPRYSQPDARAYNTQHGIVTQSWSPLGQGNDLLRTPAIIEIARTYDVTPAQVVLSWHLALGLGIVPKSSDPVRMRQNLEAGNLVLAPEDIDALTALDGSEASDKHPSEFGH